MPNTPVPIAAEGMPSFNRRRHLPCILVPDHKKRDLAAATRTSLGGTSKEFCEAVERFLNCPRAEEESLMSNVLAFPARCGNSLPPVLSRRLSLPMNENAARAGEGFHPRSPIYSEPDFAVDSPTHRHQTWFDSRHCHTAKC